MVDLTGGGASWSISRLAPAPVQSSTVVHSCTVLVAKPDLDSRCIRRLDRSLVGFSLVRLLRAVALYRGFAPVPPVEQSAEVQFASGQAVCGGSVCKRAGSLRRFCLGWLGRAVCTALYRGFAPVPPVEQSADGLFASGIFAKLF